MPQFQVHQSTASQRRAGTASQSYPTDNMISLAPYDAKRQRALFKKKSSLGALKQGTHSFAQEFNRATKTGSGGVVGNTKEVVWQATDFFDTLGDVSSTNTQVVYFDPDQGFFGDTNSGLGDVTRSFSRPVRCDVWVLPKAVNAAVSSSSVVYGTAVAVRPNGESLAGSYACGQQTMVKPDFNVEWVKVGTFDYEEIFRKSNMLPVNNDDAVELFRIACLDPDNGQPIAAAAQVMYTVTFAQNLPVSTTIKGAVSATSGFDSTPIISTGNLFALVEPLRIQNRS